MHAYFQRKSRDANKRARTRGALIDSAIEVFSTRGFDAAKISDITTGAGLANGTFYNHFRDKDELAVEATRAVALEIVQAIDDAMADVDDAGERIVTGCVRFVALAVEQADWGRVLLSWMQRFAGGGLDVARFLRADVQRGVDQGLFEIELDDFLIEELCGLVSASLRRQLRTGPDDRLMARTTQNMLRLLGFSPAKAARTVERVFRRMGRAP
jgi:AcrR family transcriptional regulator